MSRKKYKKIAFIFFIFCIFLYIGDGKISLLYLDFSFIESEIGVNRSFKMDSHKERVRRID